MAAMRAAVSPLPSAVPGLGVLRGFLGAGDREAVRASARRLAEAAAAAASGGAAARVSNANNVNSKEEYKSVVVTTDEGRRARCEHFGSYAEGHQLTYFRGALPAFGLPALLPRLAALPAVREEVAASRLRHRKRADDELHWRLTLNHYPADGPRRVGFPWHRDLIANGAATMILNLGEPGSLQFGEEPAGGDAVGDGLRYADHSAPVDAVVAPVEEVRLTDGDLLVLTGAARWEYLHRVLPDEEGGGRGERLSLVWGVW